MAGDWIPFDHDLPEKEEIVALATIAAQDATPQETALAVALLRLCRLWIWADRHTEDGLLRNMSATGVALACGGSEQFWAEVERLGWLKLSARGAVVPKFLERFGASARRRLLAAKRMQASRARNRSATGVAQGAQQFAHPQPQPQPQPLSEPVQEPEPLPEDSGVASATPCRAAPDVRRVFDHYRAYHPKSHPKPKSTSKEWRNVCDRLKDGYTADDLCRAVDGIHRIPYNLGANDQGREYLSLELIVRNSSNVAKYIEAADHPPQPQSERERRTLDAAQRWLERAKDGQAQPN